MRGGLVRWLVVAALLGVVVAGVAYLLVFITGGTGEASEPISAPQLSLPEATATPEPPAPTATAAPTPAATEDPTPVAMSDPEPTATAAPEPTATPAPTPAATAAPTPTAAPAATPTAAAAEAPAGDVPTAAVLYRIVPEESEVRFEIDEILRGAPTLVVGTTNQVAGDFIIDFTDLAASQLGTGAHQRAHPAHG